MLYNCNNELFLDKYKQLMLKRSICTRVVGGPRLSIYVCNSDSFEHKFPYSVSDFITDVSRDSLRAYIIKIVQTCVHMIWAANWPDVIFRELQKLSDKAFVFSSVQLNLCMLIGSTARKCLSGFSSFKTSDSENVWNGPWIVLRIDK